MDKQIAQDEAELCTRRSCSTALLSQKEGKSRQAELHGSAMDWQKSPPGSGSSPLHSRRLNLCVRRLLIKVSGLVGCWRNALLNLALVLLNVYSLQ